MKRTLLVISILILLVLGLGIKSTFAESQTDIIQINATVSEEKPVISAILLEFQTSQKSFEYINIPFTTIIKNNGTTNIIPSGTITIKNFLGQNTGALKINPRAELIAPDTMQKYKNYWTRDSKLGFGHYNATLNLTYGSNETLSSKIYFWIIPWKTIILTLIALAIFYLIYRIIKNEELISETENFSRVAHK